MCEPVSITLGALSIATSIASGIAGYQAQSQAAAEQERYQNEMVLARNAQIRQNEQLAAQAYLDQSNQLRLRQSEETAAASQKMQQNSLDAAQARATARVSAGEAGVAGLSIDSLLNDYYRQEGFYNDSVRQNLEWSNRQTEEDLKGTRASAIQNVLSVTPYIPDPITRPSGLAATLGIAGDVLRTTSTAYTAYRSTLPPQAPKSGGLLSKLKFNTKKGTT